MKTPIRFIKYSLILTILFLSTAAMATRFVISVANYSFSPSTLDNVHVGDTIAWIWENGSHTTTSTTIPTGAATWDSPMTATSPLFVYIPSVIGIYNYKCTPHAAMGMIGSFTVKSSDGIPDMVSAPVISTYPNPFTDVITYNYQSTGKDLTRIEVYNVTGQKVFEQTSGLSSGTDSVLNFGNLRPGLYFLKFVDSENNSWVRRVEKK